MKQCKNCGAQIADNARFCIHCMTALNEKTELKPIKIIGRWRRYSAIALLLCLALTVAIFAIPFQSTGEEPQDAPPGLSEIVNADSDGMTDSQDTPTDPISSGTSDSEIDSGSIADTNPTTDTGSQSTEQTNVTDTQESNKSTSDTIETEPSDSDSDSSDQTTENTQTVVPNPLFASGSGTEADPYIIQTAEQLDSVRLYLSSHFKLGNDIVFTSGDFEEGGAFYNGGEGWEPIGPTYAQRFSGTLDGDGHIIKYLYINRECEGTSYVGLFGYVSGGVIKNLGMDNADITSMRKTGSSGTLLTGSICGQASESATISNCYFSGRVTGESIAGGLVGHLRGTVTNCRSSGDVSSLGRYAGGIAGQVKAGSISRCYNTGNVTLNANGYAGGITSEASNIMSEDTIIIEQCYNTGNITSSSDKGGYYGGICGQMSDDRCTVRNCYNTGNVTVTSSAYAGGILGQNSVGNVHNCYYRDSVAKGIGSGTDSSTKCTDEQMKQQASYVGFDFDSVWMMGSGSYPYPILRALQPAQ